MDEIVIDVREKIARTEGNPVIVCGNNDYAVRFSFDEEWEEMPLKTMRAVWKSGETWLFADVMLKDNTAVLPAVRCTSQILVGVFAGNIHTTTAARIPCLHSVTDSAAVHPDPPQDVYHQLTALLKTMKNGQPFSFSDSVSDGPGGISEDIMALEEEKSDVYT